MLLKSERGDSFLPRDAMRKRALCRRLVSVRPSVRHVLGHVIPF